MVDGVSGTDLYRVIFDFSPEPSPAAATDDRVQGAEPSPLELAAEAVLDDVVLPLREALALSSAASQPGGAIRRAAGVVRGFVERAPAPWPPTGPAPSRPLGKERRF